MISPLASVLFVSALVGAARAESPSTLEEAWACAHSRATSAYAAMRQAVVATPAAVSGSRSELLDSFITAFDQGRAITSADLAQRASWSYCNALSTVKPGMPLINGMLFNWGSSPVFEQDRDPMLSARWGIVGGELINDASAPLRNAGHIPLPAMARFAYDGGIVTRSPLPDETVYSYCSPYNAGSLMKDALSQIYASSREVSKADLPAGRRWIDCYSETSEGATYGGGEYTANGRTLVTAGERKPKCRFRDGRLYCSHHDDVPNSSAAVRITTAGHLVMKYDGGLWGPKYSGYAWCGVSL